MLCTMSFHYNVNEMPQELNSCVCEFHFAYDKMVSCSVLLLQLTEPLNNSK